MTTLKKKVTNPRGRPIKCTPVQVSDALLASDGNLTAAATKLGVTRQGVYDYIDRYKLQDVLDQSREKMADEAVGQLHRLVRDGNLGAVIFYLKTQAKSRGYTERIEMAMPSKCDRSRPKAGRPYRISKRRSVATEWLTW